MTSTGFAKLFDHSIVRPDATMNEVLRFAETAVRLKTATLTVQPCYIRAVEGVLRRSGVLLGTVVGFPHGNETPSMKEYQAKEVLDLGAEEIDMVMSIPAVKNMDEDTFLRDIGGVVRAAEKIKVKVITENCYLSHEEKVRACRWIAQSGAHFVKTATAYAPGGATLDDVRLMSRAVGGKCRVKAAGGIREIGDILAYLRAGASRFGSTRSEKFTQAFEELPEGAKQEFRPFLENLDP